MEEEGDVIEREEEEDVIGSEDEEEERELTPLPRQDIEWREKDRQRRKRSSEMQLRSRRRSWRTREQRLLLPHLLLRTRFTKKPERYERGTQRRRPSKRGGERTKGKEEKMLISSPSRKEGPLLLD